MLSLDWRLACNARAGHPAQTFVMVASPLAIVASPLAMVAAPSVIVASPVHFIATAYPYTPHTLLEMTSFFWESGIRYLPCFFPSLFYVYNPYGSWRSPVLCDAFRTKTVALVC